MALMLTIKVVPQSGMVKWALDKQGGIKCYLKSPPENNKANVELVKLLAKALSCAQNDIIIISGATSRLKKIKISTSLTEEQAMGLLGLERQHGIL